MGKPKMGGMQRLPWKGTHLGKASARSIIWHLRDPRCSAVERIADHPMANMCHMNADLMGAAGFEAAFNVAAKRRQTLY